MREKEREFLSWHSPEMINKGNLVVLQAKQNYNWEGIFIFWIVNLYESSPLACVALLPGPRDSRDLYFHSLILDYIDPSVKFHSLLRDYRSELNCKQQNSR